MNDDDFKRFYSKSSFCFIRKRVWGFKEIFVGILHGLTKSLSVQVDILLKCFDLQALNSSKQAFSQARKKLRYEGYIALNEEFIINYYATDDFLTYKGFRLMAIDGSDLRLPESGDITQTFGCHSVCGLPMASASILYDIENRVIADSDLAKYASNEREQAYRHINQLVRLDSGRKIPTILLFDRGYPSMLLLCLMTSLGIDFVIRFEADAFVEVTKTFAQSHQLDGDITIELSSLNPRTIAKIKPFVSTLMSLKLRVIRLPREEGKDIFLLTSLSELSDSQEFKYEDFEQLYHKRWGIETQYDYLKNVMELENFATKTSLGIYQEFYATILCANIYQMLAQDASQQIKQALQQQDPENVLKDKDLLKINFTVAAGLSKNELIELVFSNKPIDVIYQRLIEKIKRNKIKEKPDREFKRKIKYIRKFYQCKRPVS